MNDNKFLEQFYKNVIIPRYKTIDTSRIEWIDHSKTGLDTWAHYFRFDGKEYVLLYEDFPGGEYINDELSYEIVKLGDKTSIKVEFKDDEDFEIVNVLGWYTLYRAK
jgi:hypothetical protein